MTEAEREKCQEDASRSGKEEMPPEPDLQTRHLRYHYDGEEFHLATERH